MDERWQRVLTCTDYYDGPLKGVADVDGVPHIYDRQFDSLEDDHSDLFTLTKPEPDLQALLLESWQMWLGWDVAYKRGDVGIDTHPALSSIQTWYKELELAIEAALERRTSKSFVMRGVFKTEGGGWRVRWSKV